MQATEVSSDTEEVDVRTPEKITEMVDDNTSSEDDRKSIGNKNLRKSQIKHHVKRKSWTEEYFGDILVTNIDQSSDVLLLESCEADERRSMEFGGDSDLCSFRSSSFRSSDVGENSA